MKQNLSTDISDPKFRSNELLFDQNFNPKDKILYQNQRYFQSRILSIFSLSIHQHNNIQLFYLSHLNNNRFEIY